ncbi:MAG: S-layer homology domain-containing protein [Oscillospiraceae bacterium]|nr:S-layer homology domain-containing protein [Oscillospiraceae bacterium]
MKKTLALLLAVIMMVSVIPFAAAADHEHYDDNGNGVCDAEGCKEAVVPAHEHYDDNGNEVCDQAGCKEFVHSKHYDDNNNGVCDYPGCKETVAHTKHYDDNLNGVCDYPGCKETVAVDPIGPGADDDDDCDKDEYPSDHHHFYEWRYNSKKHWKQCVICGYTKSSAAHRLNAAGDCYTCPYEDNRYSNNNYYGKYTITLTEEGRGDASLSTRRADSGDTVYIYVDPDYGYKLIDIEVYSSGRDYTVTRRSNGTFSFKMPSRDVRVVVTFSGSNKYYRDDVIEYSKYYGGNGSYSDVSSDAWYYSAVKYVTNREIMAGYSYNKFMPETNLIRADLAQALYNIANQPSATGSEKFSDVDRYDEYYKAVVWCSNKGIIEGWNGKFSPNGDITREDLAVMLYRYAEYKRYNTSASEDLSQFSDADAVSNYAVEAMEWAVAEGILNGMGNGKLAPQGTTTRAQAAAMLMRFVQNVA